MPERLPIPPAVRHAVIERAGDRCEKCRKPSVMENGVHNEMHLHHRRFHSEGGSDTEDNLVLLCHRCHTEYHLIGTTDVFAFDDWLALPPATHLMMLFAHQWPDDVSAAAFKAMILHGSRSDAFWGGVYTEEEASVACPDNTA